MAISRTRFVEQNVGLAPIRTNVKNRILIIDEFNRGAANRAEYITGFSYAAQNYGIDTTSGSLNYQLANDQLTSDQANFGFLRVLGRGVAASGSIVFSGTATAEDTVRFRLRVAQPPVINFPNNPPTSVILTSGNYAGFLEGRYFFKVTGITDDVATVAYQGVDLDVLQKDLVWTGASTFAVDLTADKGVAKSVTDGLSVTFGTTGQSTDIDLTVGLIFSIRVDYKNVEVPVSIGDTPEFIANNLAEALNGVDPIGQVALNTNGDGIVFSLNTVGSLGNTYKYIISLIEGNAGVTVSPDDVTTALTGGVDGPAKASLVFYANDANKTPLLQLLAKSEGRWGEGIKVSLIPRSGGKFSLNISDSAANNFNPPLQPESFDLDFLDLDSNGVLNQLAVSNYVDGIFLPKFNETRYGISYSASLLSTAPQRVLLTGNDFGVDALKDLYLENGLNGPAVTENDYVSALIEAEKFPANIILCANPKTINYSSLRTEILAHCEKMTEQEALRIAILPLKKGLTPQQAKNARNGLDSSRWIPVAGWITYAGQPNAPRFSVSAAAAYAGVIAALPFWYSPSAGNLRNIQGIVECDASRFSDYGSLVLFNDAKLEILTLDPIQQKYKFNTGNLGTSNTNWIGVYTRRAYDEIRSEIYARMLKYQGQPHDGFLRAKITSDISLYMNGLVTAGRILSFTGVTINATNNDIYSYRAGQLYISLGFQELVAATDIVITLYRDDTNGTTNFTN